MVGNPDSDGINCCAHVLMTKATIWWNPVCHGHAHAKATQHPRREERVRVNYWHNGGFCTWKRERREINRFHGKQSRKVQGGAAPGPDTCSIWWGEERASSLGPAHHPPPNSNLCLIQLCLLSSKKKPLSCIDVDMVFNRDGIEYDVRVADLKKKWPNPGGGMLSMEWGWTWLWNVLHMRCL